MKTILFDKNSAGWTNNQDSNKMFLKTQIVYLKIKCTAKGYIYLNEVYETFGSAWNPDEENVCYRHNRGGIELEFEPIENEAYLIYIS